MPKSKTAQLLLKSFLPVFLTLMSLFIFERSSLASCKIGKNKPLFIQLARDAKKAFDPKASGFSQITFYNAVLGKLLSVNDTLIEHNGLLEKAYWDFDSREYRLVLRKNLKFHNGRAVRAEDLDFSFVRFFLGAGRVDQIAFLKNIQGIGQLKKGTRYTPWSVPGIRKVDEFTVGVKLRDPNPAFLFSLSEGWISLVPHEALNEDYLTWRSLPIGAGPFQVSQVNEHSGEVKLCRRDSLSGSSSEINFISDPAYKGPLDLAIFLSDNPRPDLLAEASTNDSIGFTGLFFNYNHPLANNIHFRRALDYGIDREALAKASPYFEVLTELLTKNFSGRVKVQKNFSLEKAKAELAKVPSHLLAGSLVAEYFSPGRELGPTENKVLLLLKEQLARLGLKVQFRAGQEPTFSAREKEVVFKFDDRGTAFVDPLVIFRAFEKPAFLSPFFPKQQQRLQALLRQAESSPALDVKAASIYNLSKYFLDDLILLPLYERKFVYWRNPAVIQKIAIQNGVSVDIEGMALR